MAQSSENLPLDTRLLGNAVIEMNISRRTVSLYPGNHGLVKEALKRAFHILEELFELLLRGEKTPSATGTVHLVHAVGKSPGVERDQQLVFGDAPWSATVPWSGLPPDLGLVSVLPALRSVFPPWPRPCAAPPRS